MSFEVGKNDAFEIPLNYVNNCITAKNEVTLEFSNNDDAPVKKRSWLSYTSEIV